MSININDPWRNNGPLSDITSALSMIRDNVKCNPIVINAGWRDDDPIIVTKGCAVGWSEHCDHRGKSPIQTVIDNVREAELALLMFGEFEILLNHRLSDVYGVPVHGTRQTSVKKIE